ncbi:primase C-terminal domain-containing protein, partial [Lactococcus petauri]|uniref:primase C-terminal domain-containing protein n=1 Tax=Lactococcus petauri TaxID=1940789 RepID=UPI0021F11DBC
MRAIIEQGRRNKTLHRSLLRHARHCDSVDALRDVAEGINESCFPPLDAAEVERVVGSVWRYQVEGRNWAGREPSVSLARS